MIENINLFLGLAVIFLVFISSFFSISETALTSTSKGKIHRLAKDGNRNAIRVEKLIKNKESMIGTILLANNVVNILASAIATSVLIGMFGEAGVLYATIVMTTLILIFGEIAPKTLALRYPEKIALMSAGILLFFVKIFYPVTRNIQKAINKTFIILRIVKPEKNGQNSSEDLEEIRGTIDLKHKAGSIVKYEKDMLEGILDLGETEIFNVMMHRKNIQSINVDQKLEDILQQAFAINHSRIPLWQDDEDNIIAILDIRKLFTCLHKNKGNSKDLKLEQFTLKPWFVPSGNSLQNQLTAFRARKEKFAIVIDEYGALLGIVTLQDILEEIVGDVEGAPNKNGLKMTKLKNDTYKIAGQSHIRDINRKLNWDLPEHDENTATIAGLVISRAEKIPEENEEFEFGDYHFKTSKVKDNKILFVKVKKLNKPLEDLL
jgi:Mg2+/Co2+ transporter CorB